MRRSKFCVSALIIILLGFSMGPESLFADEGAVKGADLYAAEETVVQSHYVQPSAQLVVAFDPNGGMMPGGLSESWTLSVSFGSVLAQPEEPTRDGYVFDGWVTPEGLVFDFALPIESSVCLKARWRAISGWNFEKSRWYDSGIVARSHCFYDPESNAWYWADADGSIAAGKDVFIPRDESDRSKGGKWVRFESDRTMVKGEDCRHGAWYYFDPITGEMAHGVKLISVKGQNKWVYYDRITGKMVHGEAFLNYDEEHTGWYLFDRYSGEMLKSWRTLPDGRRVYYDPITGKMQYGPLKIDGLPHYFDLVTGRKLSAREIQDILLRVVESSYGTHPDCPAELRAAGGNLCPYGPCMSYVWWCFHHAGLDIFLNNDEIRTGWPHESYDWHRQRGRVDRQPRRGDIAYFYPTDWGPALGVSSSHAGIVLGATNGGVLIADASYGGIKPRVYSWRSISGIGHPYYE